MFISWIVTLSLYLIWQIISFILLPNEYGCVYVWRTLGSGSAIELQETPILAKQNQLFRWSSCWSWRVCKQAKLSHLGHRKPSDIHWKADAPKTSHCLVRILVLRHNERGNYSQWRSLSGHVERIFVFEDRIISRRTDVIWSPRSCDLTPLDRYLWGAVKDKCYANKPETIEALNYNIRVAIGEIQL